MKNIRIVLALAWVLSAAAVWAQAQKPFADIPVHKQSGIAYVSGGMTAPERQEMQRIGNKYPMQLIFVVEGQPPEVSGVKVKIKDLKGETQIEAVSAGPLFYFNPPSGRWTMETEYNGETITRTADLVGRRYIVLEFKFKGS